jgi:hypothetical protein
MISMKINATVSSAMQLSALKENNMFSPASIVAGVISISGAPARPRPAPLRRRSRDDPQPGPFGRRQFRLTAGF